MADAGRILIIPKGIYSTTTAYEVLDLVNHKGKCWIAKKDAIGVEPSEANSEYWFEMAGQTVANGLNITEEGYVLDARQGKVLMDAIGSTSAELAVERARIDNITRTSNEETEGNDELLDIRVAYDGTIYEEGAGVAVRAQISGLKSDLSKLQEIKWIDGYGLITNGKAQERDIFSASDFVLIHDGITANCENLYTDGGQWASICFYDELKNLLSYSQANSATAPTGAKFVKFCKLKTTTNASVSYSNFNSILFAEDLFAEVRKRDEQAMFGQTIKWTEGKYLRNNGAFYSIGTCSITDYLPCKSGTLFTAKGLFFGGDTISAFAFYDEAKNYIKNSVVSEEAESYIVPQNAKYVVFCKLTTNNYYIHSDYSLVEDLLVEKTAIEQVNNTCDTVIADNLNNAMSIVTPNARWGYVITFHARVDTMGEIKVGKSLDENGSCYVKVDAEKLYICIYSNGEYVLNNDRQGSAHGIDIQNEITVKIQNVGSTVKVTLSSLGQTFTDSVYVQGHGYNDSVKAMATNGSYSNCSLSYYCDDIDNDVWVCADSYASYWALKAYELGYTNVFINALPGQNSEGAFVQLERALTKGTPKILFWALGMNDGDNGAINASWSEHINDIIEICKNKGIELVLCTIPNTPIIDNSYKNAWIKASGHRYVDVCECVGADLSTSWYSGLLSSDNVHPTDTGAVAIANYITARIPEMIAK